MDEKDVRLEGKRCQGYKDECSLSPREFGFFDIE